MTWSASVDIWTLVCKDLAAKMTMSMSEREKRSRSEAAHSVQG